MKKQIKIAPKIKPLKRITVKVTLLVLFILSIGIGITIFYYLYAQNKTIIESRERAIKDESNVLFLAIKNNMLAGEAPIAVELFHDFSRIQEFGEIKLYRANGVSAFSDNKTLHIVNKNLKKKKFLPKTIFIAKETIDNEHFKRSVTTVDDIFVKDVGGDDKKLIIYKPLINQPKCSLCHGFNHVVRGVIKISSSLNNVYKETGRNIIISAVIYSIVVFILSIFIIFFLHNIVIKRIFNISKLVQGVGDGDFKTKIIIKKHDEIGHLSRMINDMIDSVHERLLLSKFVSKSTIEHIKGADALSLGGEKTVRTVLFTDIRGFTKYSEYRDPDEVMKMLNDVMNVQSEIIHKFNGDIDKYVGDEIMATFKGDDMVLDASKAALEIIHNMKKDFSEEGNVITVGIGINTGEMISGNMGSGKRMDRTVIGDSVNLGSRLCSIAGKNTIVISEYSLNYVKDLVKINEHESIKIKGKENPVKIYTLKEIL